MSLDGWMDWENRVYTKEYYLLLKMKEMLSYVKMWMYPEEIISEISPLQKGRNSIITRMNYIIKLPHPQK